MEVAFVLHTNGRWFDPNPRLMKENKNSAVKYLVGMAVVGIAITAISTVAVGVITGELDPEKILKDKK